MPNHVHPSPSKDAQALLDDARGHVDAGRWAAAVSCYEQAMAQLPEHPDIHHTLGLVHLETGRFDDALYHIGRSIELNPHNAVAYRSMGDALRAAGQNAMAIRSYEKACVLAPDSLDAILNLGNLFHDLNLFERAETCFKQIAAIVPGHRQALNNLGKVNQDMGRLDRALSFYDQCLALHPLHADAHFNRATLLLSMGDYRKGWDAYEWRFKRSGAAMVYPHRLDSPRWQGEDFKDRCLLVHCEQGMGDVLQFMRFLPMVRERGGKVVVEAHPPLVPLLDLQPYVDRVIAFDPHQPPRIRHDLHIPMLSLPNVLRGHLQGIPSPIPYIRVDPRDADPWQRSLEENCINIGLVWAASATNPKRNLPIDSCGAWFQHPHIHFVGLQKDVVSDQIRPLQRIGAPLTLLDHRLTSFKDTADAMAGLDLVISVDTAAAHLAGAMGKPLWVLLPFNADWRWPLDGKPSEWYPDAKIVRQSLPGNWDQVISSVSGMLQRFPREKDCIALTSPTFIDHPPVRTPPAESVRCRQSAGTSKTHIGLVNGENYGWGVCSRYLVQELGKLEPVHVLSEADGSAFNGCLDGRLFQALPTVAFDPLFEQARARLNFGYTFFENELTERSVENAKRYDLILAGSTWCRNRMLEKGIDNCEVLIQGIDPRCFYPIGGNASSDRFVIFSGGKFELRKGQDILIRAVRILQEKYADVYLVNCWYNLWPESLRQMSSSPYIKFRYRKGASWIDTMRQTYDDNGLDAERIITMDLVPHHELRTIFKQTDIGVFPNRCEGGTNLVLMEYMACAKPVIATEASGHKDILTKDNALLLKQLRAINIMDGDGALIGRWKDPSLDELVDRLEYAYHHRHAIKKIGAKAGEDLAQFTWKKCAHGLARMMNSWK